MLESDQDLRKLHIVYLVGYISYISGGPRIIVEHANNLLKRGHDVEIWTSEEGGQPYFECHVPIKMIDEAQLAKPDIVVMGDPIFMPAVAAQRSDKKSFLLVQHDWEWVNHVTNGDIPVHLFTEYKEYFTKGACTVLAVSTWVQQVVLARYGIESVLIRNAIDSTIFHEAKPLLKSNVPSVLIVYDPQVWKGFPEAVRAMETVWKRIPNLRLMIISRFFPEMPHEPGVSWGFPYPAIYFNRPGQSDLASIYASATVFVSASWLEGFGLPGLEAMACGTALVTTDSGGVCEYAALDETAVIVTPNNIESIADGILKILEDEPLRQKLVDNGLEKAKQFTWEASIDKLEENFRKAIIPVID